MVAVRLSVYVGEDRNIIIKLPDEIPVGQVDLTIEVPITPAIHSQNPQRERMRAKLLAAGAILPRVDIPQGAKRLTLEERKLIGTMPPGSRSSEELINEDRGEW